MSEELEISESNKWILRFLISGFILIIVIFGVAGGFDKQSYNNILKMEYNGIVIEKFYDKPNHNTPTLKLDSGYKFGISDKHYNIVQLSDSLYKNKNSVYAYVVRKNSIIMKIDKLNYLYFINSKLTNE